MRSSVARFGLALGLAAAVVAAPAEAACRPLVSVRFRDTETKNQVSYTFERRRFEFTLADGTVLIGEPARTLRSGGEVFAQYRSEELTITMRANPLKGRVQAAAVERLPGYNPIALVPGEDGQPPRIAGTRDGTRRTHIISVARGPAQGSVCVAGPGRPPESRAP